MARGLQYHLWTVTCAFSTALRVEVEQAPHQTAREGSSSECSSSSPSPMGVQAREESSDSAEENDRRKDALPSYVALEALPPPGPSRLC